jgi:hypothetical protein
MRSTPSRRLHSRPPRHVPGGAASPLDRGDAGGGLGEARLRGVLRLVDEATREEPGHVAVHVVDDPHDIVLGLKPLDPGRHPFEELAGFLAPRTWTTFGLCVRGSAHHLVSGEHQAGVTTTFLVDRSGTELSLLRAGPTATELPGPAEGTIPDLCRRVLGLPTEPAPPSTALLWTLAWLDAIVDAWGDRARRSGLESSWTQLALLHPAAGDAAGDGLADPTVLVALGRAHTDAWPWARLRAEPHRLPLPGGNLPSDVASWMDDGFFARWALGAYPPPPELVHDLAALVDDDLRPPLLATLAALLA